MPATDTQDGVTPGLVFDEDDGVTSGLVFDEGDGDGVTPGLVFNEDGVTPGLVFDNDLPSGPVPSAPFRTTPSPPDLGPPELPEFRSRVARVGPSPSSAGPQRFDLAPFAKKNRAAAAKARRNAPITIGGVDYFQHGQGFIQANFKESPNDLKDSIALPYEDLVKKGETGGAFQALGVPDSAATRIIDTYTGELGNFVVKPLFQIAGKAAPDFLGGEFLRDIGRLDATGAIGPTQSGAEAAGRGAARYLALGTAIFSPTLQGKMAALGSKLAGGISTKLGFGAGSRFLTETTFGVGGFGASALLGEALQGSIGFGEAGKSFVTGGLEFLASPIHAPDAILERANAGDIEGAMVAAMPFFLVGLMGVRPGREALKRHRRDRMLIENTLVERGMEVDQAKFLMEAGNELAKIKAKELRENAKIKIAPDALTRGRDPGPGLEKLPKVEEPAELSAPAVQGGIGVQSLKNLAGDALTPKGIHPTEQPVGARDIRDAMTAAGFRTFTKPYSKTREPRGFFRTRDDTIRLKDAQDVEAMMHELGHGVIKKLTGTVGGMTRGDPALRAELIAAGKEVYPEGSPKGGFAVEGAAAFMPYFMLGRPGEAQAKMPLMYAAFQKKLNENPRWIPILKEIKDLSQAWYAQGARGRSVAQIQWERPKVPLKQQAAKVRFDVQDQLKFLENFEDSLNLGGINSFYNPKGKIKSSESPSNTAFKVLGSSGQLLETAYRYNWTDWRGNPIPNGPKPLAEVLKPFHDQVQELTIYAVARRSLRGYELEMKEGDLPFSREDAQFIVDSHANDPSYLPAAKDIAAWFNQRLWYAVDTEALSPEFAENSIARWGDTYITFRSAETGGPLGFLPPSRGKRLTELPRLARTFRKGGEQIENPLAAGIAETARFIDISNRTLIAKQVFELARNHPTEAPGQMAYLIDPKDVRTTKATKKAVRDVRERLKKIRIELSDLEGKPLTDEALDQTVTFFSMSNSKELFGDLPIVVNMHKGKPEFWWLEPGLHQMTQGVEPGAAGRAFSALQAWSRTVKAARTVYRPGFLLVSNPSKDVPNLFFASKGTFLESGKLIFYDYFKNIGQMLKPRSKKSENLKRFLVFSEKAADLGFDISGMKDTQAKMEAQAAGEARRGVMGTARKILGAKPVRTLTDLFRRMTIPGELSTAFSEYELQIKKGLKAGFSFEDAESTALKGGKMILPYARTGAKTRIIEAFMPHTNPALQGAIRSVELIAQNPGIHIPKALVAFTAKGLAYWWMVKDWDYWKSLPPWARTGYYHYPNPFGDRPIPIPVAHEPDAIFGMLPITIVNYLYQKDSQGFIKEFGPLFDMINPVNLMQFESIATGNLREMAIELVYNPLPAKPLVVLGAGKDPFTKREIIPERRKGLPTVQQYTPGRTSPIIIEMSRLMLKVTGRTIAPGDIQAVIDHGIGRSVADTMDLAYADGHKRDWATYMRVALRPVDYDRNQRAMFYDLWDDVERRWSGLKNSLPGDPKPPWSDRDGRVRETLSKAKTKVDDFGRVIRVIKERGDPDNPALRTFYWMQEAAIREAFEEIELDDLSAEQGPGFEKLKRLP